jgi:hypothetical protein
MAVVLDRLGERAEALERAKQAVRDDQRPMAVLRQSRVFFVPAHESHYYEGLGLLAMAQLELGAERELARVLADAERGLSHPDAAAALLHFEQQLSGLREDGHADLLASFERWVTQRKAELARVKPKKKLGPRVNPRPEPAEAKVILLTVQSLRAFLRFLDRGGAQGPWSLDAQAHINQLLGWFEPGRALKK